MTDDNHPQHSDIKDDMWTEVDEIIAANRDVPGSVIGVLRECQDVEDDCHQSYNNPPVNW